jgi:ATP-dependent DNA helicase RecG
MRTTEQILELLPQLDHVVADDLEDQDLDFKNRETTLAAELCQRPEAAMRNTLSRMERDLGWIQRGGTGRGTYWTLSRALAKQLNPSGKVHSRIDWEAAKTRVLSVLMQRHQSGQEGLRNVEIRALTHFDRNQVFRLMRELQQENPQVSVTGHGVSARHVWNP